MAIGFDSSTAQPGVVARHAHFGAAEQVRRAGHVRRAEVELRTVAAEERRVTATFFFRQHVHFGFELRVRGDRTRLGQHLTALNVFTLHTTEQATDVVAGLALIERLVEHFDARAGRALSELRRGR